jgi:HEPN domain-containing protein
MCGKATETITPSIHEEIASTIARLTHAEKIFFISEAVKEREPQYDFLALLPGNTPLRFSQYKTLVADACRALGCVVLWCNHLGAAYKLLREGHLFYSTVCMPERLVYDNCRLPLPGATSVDADTIIERSGTTFHHLFATAASFLDGARYYAVTSQWKTAAFLLHQAAEHALRAFIFSSTGYNGYGHGLDHLLRQCSYCAPQLNELFPQDTGDNKRLFHLLNSAYTHTRYKPHYAISATELAILLERVAQLHTRVQHLFEQRLITFKQTFLCANK